MKLAVRMKLVVNGKVYGSAEELPDELRSACEKAVAAGAGPGHPADTIEVNGRRYDSREAMPPETRAMYDAALAGLPGREGAATAAGPRVAPDHERPDPDIEPAGASRWSLALLAGAGALVLWYFLRLRG